MLNNSKEKLLCRNLTYKEIAFILNISERQAMNILNKDNKSLFNYLALAHVSGILIEEMFQLEDDEINELLKRKEIIETLKR